MALKATDDISVDNAIRKLKNGKTIGPDMVPITIIIAVLYVYILYQLKL